ncbi:MAG TPA: iron-sulfur cluster assembly scaffold protein [Pyrinomonadaceae bacterium]|nr:iron-sulfur cluster assembly scaffold protein [Pyrinomonadaceae bacterium]
MPENLAPAIEEFAKPKHVGEAMAANFSGDSASFQCGAVVRISLHIDESQRITDAGFKAAGCSVLIGSASLLLDQIIGKTTAEAAAVAQSRDAFRETLGHLPAERKECPSLACDALISAIRNYSGVARDEWEGEEALICTCFCVSERTIEREIQKNGLRTIDEVTLACSAGGGCRSCYPLIEDILEAVNGEWSILNRWAAGDDTV